METHVGQQVYFYPKGTKFENTVPRVAFVNTSHPGGIVDITVLPTQDGVCEYQAHVFPAGHRLLRDGLGNLSSAARERGFWEPYVAPKPAKAKTGKDQ